MHSQGKDNLFNLKAINKAIGWYCHLRAQNSWMFIESRTGACVFYVMKLSHRYVKFVLVWMEIQTNFVVTTTVEHGCILRFSPPVSFDVKMSAKTSPLHPHTLLHVIIGHKQTDRCILAWYNFTSSLAYSFVCMLFSCHQCPQIGVDFALKIINWDDNTVIRVQLWDIAGKCTTWHENCRFASIYILNGIC